MRSIVLTNDMEKLSRSGTTFGLNGFFLLFRAAPDVVPPDEFDFLTNYAHQLIHENSWPACTDVINALSAARLSKGQQSQLLNFISSILDLNLFPYQNVYNDRTTWIEEMQFSPILARILKIFAAKRDDRSDELYLTKAFQPEREHNSYLFRQQEVIWMLSILAYENQEAIEVLHNLTMEALKQQQGNFPNRRGIELSSALLEFSLERLLYLAGSHVQALETLYTCLNFGEKILLTDEQVRFLSNSNVWLCMESAELLLNIIRNEGHTCLWAEQTLEYMPNLEIETIFLLQDILPNEQNVAVLQILARRQDADLLEDLANRLIQLLFDSEVPLHIDWIVFLSQILEREPLRQVLDQVVGLLTKDRESFHQMRSRQVLYMIGQEVYRMSQPDAVTLAVCSLFDPTDLTQNSRSLAERVQKAKQFLNSSNDLETTNRIVKILDLVATNNEHTREAIARSLRSFSPPEPEIISLLEKLMDMAVFDTNPALYEEAFKSLASLNPLTPQALHVIQDRLILAYEIDHPILLTPQIIYDEVLPLVPTDIDKQSIKPLVEMVWRCHCPICSQIPFSIACEKFTLLRRFEEQLHRYFHAEPEIQEAEESLLLYALQALTNTSALSQSQQWILKRLWQTSWRASVKARALIILSRQKTDKSATLFMLEHVFTVNPFVSFYSTMIKDGLRQGIFRWFRRQAPSRADWGYLFLCQTVGVYALQEINADAQYRKSTIKALLRLVSPVRWLTEQWLIREASVGINAPNRSLAGIIRQDSDPNNVVSFVHENQIPSNHEDKELALINRPSESAYRILYSLNLNSAYELTLQEKIKRKVQAWSARIHSAIQQALKRTQRV